MTHIEQDCATCQIAFWQAQVRADEPTPRDRSLGLLICLVAALAFWGIVWRVIA